MNLKRYLSKSRIVDVSATDFSEAVGQLLECIPDSILGGAERKDVVENLIERERSISTYLGHGICMPHTRVPGLRQKYVFAVGKCTEDGINFDGLEDYKQTRILFLMLSDEKVDNYLSVLSNLAKIFSADVCAKIKLAADLPEFKDAVMGAFNGGKSKSTAKSETKRKPMRNEERLNDMIMRSAFKISKAAKCSAIILLGDSFTEMPDISSIFGDSKVVIVSEKPPVSMPPKCEFISVRSFSDVRFSQLRSAVMIGLTRGTFGAKEKICCLGGVRESNLIDTIVMLDIGKEFSNVFIGQKNMLPEGVTPEVLERVLDIATELSVEGREGKPVGCIFVIGSAEELKPHLKQLILNPFYGYKPEDRNVLNPFMDETVKEYSLIDGAFIIDSSGVLEAAGALIHTPDFKLQLPGGLGARHAAAYSISLMADCISIVVSSSTGQITLFRKGQMLPITEKRK